MFIGSGEPGAQARCGWHGGSRGRSGKGSCAQSNALREERTWEETGAAKQGGGIEGRSADDVGQAIWGAWTLCCGQQEAKEPESGAGERLDANTTLTMWE